MNPDWQHFLTKNGAMIESNIVQRFTDTPAELLSTKDNTVLCDLSQFGALRVSGEEAQAFLQNMLSNDIREVSTTRAQYSSLISPKGRMLATMLIRCESSDYMVQLPHTLTEVIRKKLSMYVLRSKVKINAASDDIVTIGLSGTAAPEILHRQFGELPLLPLGLVDTGTASIIKIGDTRFQINTTPHHAPALWQTLSQHAQPVGSICWDWLNIHAGIPVILPATQEEFVPQMANLDLIGGVNFKKGCYPGQEVVARMHYLGKLKRRMYLAHLDGPDTPQPCDELFSADMEGQPSGVIVNAAPAPGGGYDMLAVIQIASHEALSVHWKSLQGEALQFLPLPYALPES